MRQQRKAIPVGTITCRACGLNRPFQINPDDFISLLSLYMNPADFHALNARGPRDPQTTHDLHRRFNETMLQIRQHLALTARRGFIFHAACQGPDNPSSPQFITISGAN